jgi:hypothetical protein
MMDSRCRWISCFWGDVLVGKPHNELSRTGRAHHNLGDFGVRFDQRLLEHLQAVSQNIGQSCHEA